MIMSSTDILNRFYQRMMPLFPPQAERILETAPVDNVSQLSFRYTFSVSAMTKVSRIIEDAAMASPRTSELHASFQYLSRLTDQQARYQRVAENTNGLWLYYAADTDPAPFTELLSSPYVTTIDTGDSPMVNYWFVIAYGPGVNMTLLAQEVDSLAGEDRYYEGFYTFEPDPAYQVLSILHQIYPDAAPRPTAPEQMSQ
jgi:DICT domain-containing protein